MCDHKVFNFKEYAGSDLAALLKLEQIIPDDLKKYRVNEYKKQLVDSVAFDKGRVSKTELDNERKKTVKERKRLVKYLEPDIPSFVSDELSIEQLYDLKKYKDSNLDPKLKEVMYGLVMEFFIH